MGADCAYHIGFSHQEFLHSGAVLLLYSGLVLIRILRNLILELCILYTVLTNNSFTSLELGTVEG